MSKYISVTLTILGGLSASEFLQQVGMDAAGKAVEVFLEFIGLDDKISVDDVCDQQAIMDSQGGNRIE